MSFTVKVKTIPGTTEVFNSDVPIDVNRACALAKVAKPENWTASIGGEGVDGSREISSDTTITLIKKNVKGNRS